jgi:hypothetical protein
MMSLAQVMVSVTPSLKNSAAILIAWLFKTRPSTTNQGLPLTSLTDVDHGTDLDFLTRADKKYHFLPQPRMN